MDWVSLLPGSLLAISSIGITVSVPGTEREPGAGIWGGDSSGYERKRGKGKVSEGERRGRIRRERKGRCQTCQDALGK